MFGPDICGSSTKKVHLIFNYDGKNHLLKKNVPCETDEFTHLYTMILHPDNTYTIEIDQKGVATGSLKEDWDMLEPKDIKDPEAKKPAVCSLPIFSFFFSLLTFANRTGLMPRRSLTPRTRNPRDMMTPPPKSPTPRLPSPRTGMMSWMVSGKPPRLPTPSSRESGSPR